MVSSRNNHLVIMAGGVGSRFWPMSTVEKPKQFIDVLGVGKSLLQLTVERFGDICKAENVWVVTNKAYVNLVKEQLPELPDGNILCEPCRRNTAPCIAYVSWKIKSKDPKANIVVTPSDHIVTNTEEFRRVIKSCLDFTMDSDAIVTLGMKPTRPEPDMDTFRPTSQAVRCATRRFSEYIHSAKSPTSTLPSNISRRTTTSGMPEYSSGTSAQSSTHSEFISRQSLRCSRVCCLSMAPTRNSL